MVRHIVIALALMLLGTTANPREAAVDEEHAATAPMRSGELRADVDPRGWWMGPEI